MSIRRFGYSRILSPVLDRIAAGSMQPAGWYKVEVDGRQFFTYSHGSGAFARARMRGNLEPEVMEVLAEYVEPGCRLYDIGSAWGYFTQAGAALGGTVTAFELIEERCELIREGAERNGWPDRVSVEQGVVGSEISLGDYPVPDVVKMDIEGWEYEALSEATELLETGPTLIVEVHEPETCDEGIPARPGDEVEQLLDSHGFDARPVGRRSESNYHLLATPTAPEDN